MILIGVMAASPVKTGLESDSDEVALTSPLTASVAEGDEEESPGPSSVLASAALDDSAGGSEPAPAPAPAASLGEEEEAPASALADSTPTVVVLVPAGPAAAPDPAGMSVPDAAAAVPEPAGAARPAEPEGAGAVADPDGAGPAPEPDPERPAPPAAPPDGAMPDPAGPIMLSGQAVQTVNVTVVGPAAHCVQTVTVVPKPEGITVAGGFEQADSSEQVSVMVYVWSTRPVGQMD